MLTESGVSMASTIGQLRQVVASGTDPVKIRRAFQLLVEVICDLQRKIDTLEDAVEAPVYMVIRNDDEDVVLNDSGNTIWTLV